MADIFGTGLGNKPYPSTTIYPETVDNGYPQALMVRGWCTGVPTDTTASRYAPSAVLIRTDAPVNRPLTYVNSGTTAVPVWTEQTVTTGGVSYGSVAVQVTTGAGTNLFGATVPFQGTITSVTGFGVDATGGTLTLVGSNGTIAAVQKIAIGGGTASMVTGSSISNASVSFAQGSTLIANCSAGNGVLIATFITS